MINKRVDTEQLRRKAIQFRREILEVVHRAKCGHPGGSLSLVEILITLYELVMKHRPDDPQWPERDRLILSKGHATPAAYVALANYGYFPKKELETFRRLNTRLQGHIHQKAPGAEFNTGSLGHGLSVANGLAMAAKLGQKKFRVYCILGDGEIQEGSIWEAAMTSSHFNLDHVCAILDYNKVQENGPVKDIMNLEPLAERWTSFGWSVVEADGHDFDSLLSAFQKFDAARNKPTLIIAHTIKGKGVSFMEGNCNWHGKAPKDEEYQKALAELI